MVKILANGEIVQDNDARLKNRSQQKQGKGFGNIQQVQDTADSEEQQYHGQGDHHGYQQDGGDHGPSVFSALNQKLLDAGIPSFNIGEHVIEPIVSVGCLLAFIVLGFRGILFVGLLFVVHKLSMRPGGLSGLFRSLTGGGGRGGGHRRPRNRSSGAGGQRLGGQRLGSSSQR